MFVRSLVDFDRRSAAFRRLSSFSERGKKFFYPAGDTERELFLPSSSFSRRRRPSRLVGSSYVTTDGRLKRPRRRYCRPLVVRDRKCIRIVGGVFTHFYVRADAKLKLGNVYIYYNASSYEHFSLCSYTQPTMAA